MDPPALRLILCILLFVKGTDVLAASPGETYWHTALPNTPMPSIIQQLLLPARSGKVEYCPGRAIDTSQTVTYGTTPAEAEVIFREREFVSKKFFLEQNLLRRPGAIMETGSDFTRADRGIRFLPEDEARAAPFSSARLPDILARHSAAPGSSEAAAIVNTLRNCEAPAAAGERKFCATSLESLVGFVASVFGSRRSVQVSTTTDSAGKMRPSSSISLPRQQYRLMSPGVKALPDKTVVACHSQPYPYGVYYCHATGTTRPYLVPLMGMKDGTVVSAVAVCHENTNVWNPAIFEVLKVKPGTPLCHFLGPEELLWTAAA